MKNLIIQVGKNAISSQGISFFHCKSCFLLNTVDKEFYNGFALSQRH
jgi:hypothetical protein